MFGRFPQARRPIVQMIWSARPPPRALPFYVYIFLRLGGRSAFYVYIFLRLVGSSALLADSILRRPTYTESVFFAGVGACAIGVVTSAKCVRGASGVAPRSYIPSPPEVGISMYDAYLSGA